jgi:glycosyltransferase involved in cell wall biosynthesis
MERTLREFAARHRLEERVHFIEPQPQASVARWMNAADCLTLTSAYEGLPRVVIEAMRCGLPSVCVDNGEVSRLIDGPETGKLVPSRDPEAIRDALRDQLSRKPDRPALREAAREFGAERILSRLFASYREMNGTHVREREALAS